MTPFTIPDSEVPLWIMAVGYKVICGATVNVVVAMSAAPNQNKAAS